MGTGLGVFFDSQCLYVFFLAHPSLPFFHLIASRFFLSFPFPPCLLFTFLPPTFHFLSHFSSFLLVFSFTVLFPFLFSSCLPISFFFPLIYSVPCPVVLFRFFSFPLHPSFFLPTHPPLPLLFCLLPLFLPSLFGGGVSVACC